MIFFKPCQLCAAISRIAVSVILACLVLSCDKQATRTLTGKVNWSVYEIALQKTVVEARRAGVNVNLVNYAELRENKPFLVLADDLAKMELRFANKMEKMAFYINAYNYFAIKIVLDKFPEKSIRDIGNVVQPVWKRTVGKIAGKDVSLDSIEHKVLRSMGEPRIHFAIVCASLSCPNLRRELYTAEKLEYQLEDQARGFINDDTKGAVERDGKLYLSKIFSWFGDDFEKDGGVLPFVRRYRQGLDSYDKFKTMDYHWELNEIKK